jgi:hypothetical protein
MRRLLLLPAVLAAAAVPAAAQRPTAMGMKLSDLAGTWDARTMIGPKDSVVATYALTASADGKTWTLKFPNRDPLATRILTSGGDSLVTETGPYSSVLRPGVMVTTRTTVHFKGNTMTGTFMATYANGDILRGKVAGTRKP